ncbi:MAG: fibronectin type III domain-containing protein [Eubacteriaceae bacterium]|nr:fibronectin type III domain-containing protein [Eubacteriaceae bacterium]
MGKKRILSLALALFLVAVPFLEPQPVYAFGQSLFVNLHGTSFDGQYIEIEVPTSASSSAASRSLDFSAADKQKLSEAKDATGNAVNWYFHYSSNVVMYDFGKTLKENLIIVFGEDEYEKFYISDADQSIDLYAGTNAQLPTWLGFTGSLTIEIVDSENIISPPISDFSVSVQNGILSDLTAAQKKQLDDAIRSMPPGGYLAFQFASSSVVYDLDKPLFDNIIAAYGQTGWKRITTTSLTPTIKLNVTTGPVGAPVGKGALSAAHINSSTIKLTEISTGSNATTFVLGMSSSSGGTYSTIATLTLSNRSYEATGLAIGEYYYFKSTPYNGINGGTASEVLSVRARPQRPATMQATAQSRAIRLTWGAVSDCDGYAVYTSELFNGTYELAALVSGKNSLSTTISGLSPGRQYYLKVCSYKQSGAKKVPSVYSGPVAATPR